MTNCAEGITIPTTPRVLIQYSVDGISGWTSTLNNTHYYIRFSYNSGASWSAARKFVGDDGVGSSFLSGILYSNLVTTEITPTGSLVIVDSYTIAGNTLSSAGDALRIVSFVELPIRIEIEGVTLTVSMYWGNTNPESLIGTAEIMGEIDSSSRYIKLETTINRIDENNQFIETMVYRSSDPGRIEESPISFAGVRDLSTNQTLYLTITDALGGGSSYMKMLRIELMKLIN